MKRRRLRILATLSLTTCGLFISLWIFSSVRSCWLRVPAGSTTVAELDIGLGEMCLGVQAKQVFHHTLFAGINSTDGWIFPPGMLFGFAYRAFPHGQAWYIPIWLPMWISFILSILTYRKAWPPRAGLCANCGYDLRATPDRCPECGTIPAKVTEAKA